MVKVGIVGAQGMVGRTMLGLLVGEYKIDNSELVLFEHDSLVGKTVNVGGKNYVLQALTRENLESQKLDYVLFAGGGDVSKIFAPIVAELGGIAIDNSSVFRMQEGISLVVPEVNGGLLKTLKGGGIVANPNCSTTQAVVAIKPLVDTFGLKRIVYSTYQAVSGAGQGGINDFEGGISDPGFHKQFNYPIFSNLIPQIDVFEENGYTKEEMKMIEETKKILGMPELAVTCTAVRVPVKNSHSVAINLEFEHAITLEEVRKVLAVAEKEGRGIILMDDPSKMIYPMPMKASGTDAVYVGRVRLDTSNERGINLFCVADNLRKGAATNAVQILRELVKR
ncbi:MAG: aspartate-semialdehyde dehydrogenase [Firmicutes bacterium]|nr:aspartate-semialdehyde dehydrogenase [Bacillota bacterium]